MGRKTGILGGTFNPPHIGHLEMAKRAKAELGLSRVIFIPAKIPPHKQMPEHSPSANDRLEMLSLAVSELSFAEISKTELERPGKSYTVDTLKELKSRYPGDDFFLLLGSDMLYTFDSWYKPDEIASMCDIVAFPRKENELSRMSECADMLRARFKTRVQIISVPAIEVSSTEIRRILETKERDERLPGAVFDYIVRKELYTALH